MCAGFIFGDFAVDIACPHPRLHGDFADALCGPNRWTHIARNNKWCLYVSPLWVPTQRALQAAHSDGDFAGGIPEAFFFFDLEDTSLILVSASRAGDGEARRHDA